MTISNANGVMLEVRRERGQTYARRPGTGWQRAASTKQHHPQQTRGDVQPVGITVAADGDSGTA